MNNALIPQDQIDDFIILRARAFTSRVLRMVTNDVLKNENHNDIHSNKVLNNINKINAILTPHLGGATIKSMNIAEKYVINNLYKAFKND